MGNILWRCFTFQWYNAPKKLKSIADALQSLRETQSSLTRCIQDKKIRIQDCDRTIIEIGLKRQEAKKRNTRYSLCEVDAQTLRRQFKHRLMLLTSRNQFVTLVSNIDSQVLTLEDSGAIDAALRSMRSGADAQNKDTIDFENALTIVDSVRDQMEQLKDKQRLMEDHADDLASISGLNESELETELADMMKSESFIGQFNPKDIEAEIVQTNKQQKPIDPLVDVTSKVALHAMEEQVFG